MIKKLLVIGLVLILALTIVSCDRFDKPVSEDNQELETEITEDFQVFIDLASVTNSTNIDELMVFFTDDYLNNGETKQSIQQRIESMFTAYNNAYITVSLLEVNGVNIKWSLSAFDANQDVFDSMEFYDVMHEVNGMYLLYGNQQQASNDEKMPLLAEIFTATWCGTCPEVEAAMHDYQINNPSNFFYLEYHNQDGLTEDMEFFSSFYGLTTTPNAIIQGKDILSSDQIDAIPTILDSYKDTEASFKLNNFTQIDDPTNFVATVEIEALGDELPTAENLKLRWAFYEETSSTNNYAGQPCRHIVLTEGFLDVTAAQLSGESVNLNLSYPRSNETDLGIAIWLQECGDSYDDTSMVYTWTKLELGE